MNALHTALCELDLQEIISFEVAFRRYLNQAYTWDLWGAAWLIHCCWCSADCFEYFRRWLVSRGREVYEAALADPDSLAQQKVAVRVFKEKGGVGDVRDYSEPEAGMVGYPPGEDFLDDEEQLARRYPKLWQRFRDHRSPWSR